MLNEIIDPATGQNVSQIQIYLRSVDLGDLVAIRESQAGILKFTTTEVTGKSKSGRIYTERSGAFGGNSWYAKSGKSCTYPKGQSRLFIPTTAINDYILSHPNGVMTYKIHNPDA